MKAKFFTLVLVAVLAATTIGFVPGGILYSPLIDERVGGIDFDQYCRSIGATHHGIETSKGREGVYCQFDSGGKIQWLTKENIDQACRNQYGSSAYAAHDGTNHPYAWYCAGPSQPSSSPSQPSNSSNNQPSNQNQNNSPTNTDSGSNITTAACSGYVKDFLSGSASPPSGKYLTTGYDKVLLRSSPDRSKCTYGWLSKGEYYPVLSESGGWYKTRAGGLTGWVMAMYVSMVEGSSSSSATSTKLCKVKAYPVNEGRGTLTDQNYFMYVYLDHKDGYFMYNDTNGWHTITDWSRWNYDSDGFSRWGLSTKWAYAHPGWLNFQWKYIYKC